MSTKEQEQDEEDVEGDSENKCDKGRVIDGKGWGEV